MHQSRWFVKTYHGFDLFDQARSGIVGKADHDKLSAKGCRQAEILGRLLGHLVKPDRFYRGDLLRHRQTAEHFIAGVGSHPCPSITHPGFNEFDQVQFLLNYRPEQQDPVVMKSDIANHSVPAKAFQETFVAALGRWTSGAHDDDCQESWAEFKKRCRAA